MSSSPLLPQGPRAASEGRRDVASRLEERLSSPGGSAFLRSWIYVFGVATIAALGVVIVSGLLLSLKGLEWWHDAPAGHFFNSIHLWSVELTFFFMVVHLSGKYWMAAWRGGRTRVWMSGAIALLVAVPTALTGYLSQQNFDAQWIALHAKDAVNSIGAGAFFNVTNFGQMYGYHIVLLPLALIAIVIAHVTLVRRHGAVPPFDASVRLDARDER
jgi:quinol---cytochrome c reductase cytochrome b subunit, bacillus type